MANKGKSVIDDSPEYEEIGGEEQSRGLIPFLEENQRMVIMVVGILLVLLLGFLGYRYLQSSKNSEAQEEMITAVRFFEADSLDRALNGDGSFLGFLDIAEEYSGTDAANMAEYYTGIIYARQGDADMGLEYLDGVEGNGTLMETAIYQAKAFCYEQLEEWENAAKNFERAATSPSESPLTPGLLLKAGQNYEDAGDIEKALEMYEKIKEDYPRTPEALTIDKYIGRISE